MAATTKFKIRKPQAAHLQTLVLGVSAETILATLKIVPSMDVFWKMAKLLPLKNLMHTKSSTWAHFADWLTRRMAKNCAGTMDVTNKWMGKACANSTPVLQFANRTIATNQPATLD